MLSIAVQLLLGLDLVCRMGRLTEVVAWEAGSVDTEGVDCSINNLVVMIPCVNG